MLELGCGAGQFIRAIKKARPELVCTGSDISKTAIELAQKQNDGVTYVLQNTSATPFANQTFDAVVICDVLEHVEDPAAVLAEVKRVLKPGGVFYAFVPCEGDSLSLWHALDVVGLKKNLTTRFAGHIQFFSRQSLKKLFAQTGFSKVQFYFSEHILGQLLGVIAFNLMARASRRAGGAQLNNEEYFDHAPAGTAIKLAKALVNSLVYLESRVLRHVPSPNVHVVARVLGRASTVVARHEFE